MGIAQVMNEIEKDSPFYWNTGGGMTLSGGEPTLQPEFCLEILKSCKQRSIHTAMETCGYVKWAILDEFLHHLDLVYMDIKHMSPETHKKLTGKSNAVILRNIRKAAAICPDGSVIIRIPIVPGINDSDQNIIETAIFVRQLGGDRKLEFLPYHKLGVPNYEVLGKQYILKDPGLSSEERLHFLAGLAEAHDVKVEIGG